MSAPHRLNWILGVLVAFASVTQARADFGIDLTAAPFFGGLAVTDNFGATATVATSLSYALSAGLHAGVQDNWQLTAGADAHAFRFNAPSGISLDRSDFTALGVQTSLIKTFGRLELEVVVREDQVPVAVLASPAAIQIRRGLVPSGALHARFFVIERSAYRMGLDLTWGKYLSGTSYPSAQITGGTGYRFGLCMLFGSSQELGAFARYGAATLQTSYGIATATEKANELDFGILIRLP